MRRRAKVMLVAALATLTAGCNGGGLACQWFGWGCPPPPPAVPAVPGVGTPPPTPPIPPLPPPPPVLMDEQHKKVPPSIVQFHPGHLPPVLFQGQHGKPPVVVELHPGPPANHQP